MKLTRFPFIALTLSALAATSQAQVSSHIVRSVDAYGNVVKTQVRTPLADSRSAAGYIARQGVLGANTTTSTTIQYGSSYGNIQQNYCPPTQYVTPVYPYGYSYNQYPDVVNNNYYYPQYPTTTAIAPPSNSWAQPSWVTNIPLGNSYSAPAVPGYGYAGNPYGAYNNGQGYSTLVPIPGGYAYGVGVQVGGGGRFGNTTTTTTTTTTTRGGAAVDYRHPNSVIHNPQPLLAPGQRPNMILPGYPGNR